MMRDLLLAFVEGTTQKGENTSKNTSGKGGHPRDNVRQRGVNKKAAEPMFFGTQ